MKLFLAAAVCAATAAAHAQGRVQVGDMGPGPSGRLLRTALEHPYRLVEPDTQWFVLPRGAEVPTTLVVLGRTVAVEGTVRGDVFVVGGDLFIHPGGHVTGNATAIGGAVYPSSLGFVEGQMRSFRDNSFAISRTSSGYRLDYVSLREGTSPPLLLPGVYGLRMPTYDRADGVSVPYGPTLSLDTGRVEIDALGTYRSDLGKLDPGLTLATRFSRRIRIDAHAARGTFTNDAWIWSDFVNSASSLVFGTDTRNYFRADRADARAHYRWEFSSSTIEPFVGVLTENAWSVGPSLLEQRGPWSLFEREDSLGMWRPNPPVEAGHLTSGLLGATMDWALQDVSVAVRSVAEAALSAPGNERFQQFTSDATVSFPTFGEQTYAVDAHWVATLGDTPPPQRFAWFGGAGTMPFIDLLSEGGDQLLLIDQRYSVPLTKPVLGLLGAPTLLLRQRIGSAGVNRLPAFHQMWGVGVLLTLVRVELDFDPALRKARVGAGFSFSR